MMDKRKSLILLLIVAVAIISALLIPAAVALMLRKSPNFNNSFIPAQVSCAVDETFVDNKKTSVKVDNTSNIPVYIRLRVVTYWQDSKGNVVARTSPVNEFGSDWKYDDTNWLYDAKEQTFYCKKPVGVGGETAELLKLQDTFQGIQLTPKTETYNGVDFVYYPVMEFVAEAIQSQPGKAVTESWKVTLDGEGNINGIT